MELLHQSARRALALAALLAALWAAAPAARAAAPNITGFSIEQVYVNVPDVDVFVNAVDTNGEPLSPSLVRAAGVQLKLGEQELDTGNIQKANEPVCYIFALDNSSGIDAKTFNRLKTAIRALTNHKDKRDQVAIYTLAGSDGLQCVLPATADLATIGKALDDLQLVPGAAQDFLGAAAEIYADINKNYQSLAPRKLLLGYTDSISLLRDLPLVAGIASGAADQLGMPFRLLVSCEDKEDLALLEELGGGQILFCTRSGLRDAILGQMEALKNALELKTAIDPDLYGERLETLTLSVPAMGSAVSASTTVYMGHRLTRPAVEAVQQKGRDTLEVRFNQAVSDATAGLATGYLIKSEDVWGFRVGVHAAELSDDGRTATLTTDPLYDGSYSVCLRNVAAALSSANTSDASVKTLFALDGRPRDRGFYLARLRLPALILGAILLVLAVQAFGRSRRERAAEHSAEVEHLLSGAQDLAAYPRRWLTLFIQLPGEITEGRWAAMVESSLLIGSDPALCELCLADEKVSAQHCILALDGDAVLLQPLGKARVTVNGRRIGGVYRLCNDDTIRVGRTALRAVL